MPNTWLDGYIWGCKLVHSQRLNMGWCRAKGKVKSQIVTALGLQWSYQYPPNAFNGGMIDALLDSVN